MENPDKFTPGGILPPDAIIPTGEAEELQGPDHLTRVDIDNITDALASLADLADALLPLVEAVAPILAAQIAARTPQAPAGTPTKKRG